MADLEDAGLLYAPHTSAGRLPTETGLRLFVDGLRQVGDLTGEERTSIETRCAASGTGFQEVLTQATAVLSGLSGHAGLVVAPKVDAPLRHVEFVPVAPGRALVVLVSESGQVENRMLDMPMGMTGSALAEAGQRSEEHTSELQSLMRISYAVFCLKKKKTKNRTTLKRRHEETQ